MVAENIFKDRKSRHFVQVYLHGIPGKEKTVPSIIFGKDGENHAKILEKFLLDSGLNFKYENNISKISIYTSKAVK